MVVSTRTRRALALTFFLALLPLIGLLEVKLQVRATAGRAVLPAERYYLPPPSVLRALCFGYNEVAADLLWIRTIAYFTDHLSSDQDQRHLKRHLGNILALDPRFKEIYRYGASMISLGLGEARSNEDLLWAIDLLKQAHRLFPTDYRFPLNIGIFFINDLRTTDRELRARWRREGADWVTRASLIGADIPWLPALAARVYSEEGRRDLAIQRLEEIYLVTPDEKTREQIRHKLRHLQATKQATELARTAREFEEAHRTSSISFVPPDLFVFLRQQPLRPFTLSPSHEGSPSRGLEADRPSP